ncbi:MAG TPA: hypothetical protein VFJ73_03405 [Bacillales bacterium]|nr:hypothetical protein [Bacillales bacterium]
MMIGLLLLISFMLHGICLYWIFRLKQGTAAATEVENVLAAYSEQIREENDEFIRRLEALEHGDSRAEGETPENSRPLKKKNETEPAEAEISEADRESGNEKRVQEDETGSFSSPADGVEDRFEPSLEARVLSLADQGFDHETIAKKLNCGKGEVELMIRLAQSNKSMET